MTEDKNLKGHLRKWLSYSALSGFLVFGISGCGDYITPPPAQGVAQKTKPITGDSYLTKAELNKIYKDIPKVKSHHKPVSKQKRELDNEIDKSFRDIDNYREQTKNHYSKWEKKKKRKLKR